MSVRIIETALRDYGRKKSVIETTLLRIEQFEKAIDDPVEKAMGDKEDSKEILEEWIENNQSRIYPYQIEKEQIDAALGALTKQQRFIVECKYYGNMSWRDIEILFNEKFRRQNYITYQGLRKINKQTVDILVEILESYYNRFKTK